MSVILNMVTEKKCVACDYSTTLLMQRKLIMHIPTLQGQSVTKKRECPLSLAIK